MLEALSKEANCWNVEDIYPSNKRAPLAEMNMWRWSQAAGVFMVGVELEATAGAAAGAPSHRLWHSHLCSALCICYVYAWVACV